MIYQFEWDPLKNKTNLNKHKVDFRRAVTIFHDPNQLSIYDGEHSQDEDRWVTMGIDNTGNLLVVVHTYNQIDEETIEIRIISSRRATSSESKYYLENN